MDTNDNTRGAYFLANDTVREMVVAFLNSFRRNNPDLPLCLVPFDDRVDAIMALEAEYRFSVWDDKAILHKCDALSVHMHGAVIGHYRKLALWHGRYDTFVYIDTDTVILASLDFIFPLAQLFGFVASHSNIPSIRKYVWKESIRATQKLTQRQLAYSANTGFFGTQKGYLTFDDAKHKLPAAMELLDHMELDCAEQPFLNYLVVTSGRPYTSLYALRSGTGLSLPREQWAGGELRTGDDGLITSLSEPIFLVHWAGFRSQLGKGRFPHLDLWNYYRHLRD